jgi:hypothetical protein
MAGATKIYETGTIFKKKTSSKENESGKEIMIT